ncbi:hypothetical protein [Streptomyces sp. NPDC003717]|uniref:hypothetical protein n=1 Tax=Streptomyces sp. NPDC003717 TaxID=3154276 RepID=UPI0033B5A8CE
MRRRTLLATAPALAAVAASAPAAQAHPAGHAVTALMAAELGGTRTAGRIAETLEHTLLARQPATAPLSRLEYVVAFSFGNRLAADGTATPGPMNAALATVVEHLLRARRVPVYGQWEIADVLADRGIHDVIRIAPDHDADGKEIYLSTDGVALKALQHRAAQGHRGGTAGVIGHRDHAGRCALTIDSHHAAYGTEGRAPAGLPLPAWYDRDSGQPWTRDADSFLTADTTGRLALAAQSLQAMPAA